MRSHLHTTSRSTASLVLTVVLALTSCGGTETTGDRAPTRSPATSSTTNASSGPAPPVDGQPTTTTTATRRDTGGPHGTPARILISSIGVDAPVVDLNKNPDGTLQVPGWSDAGWWERGPEPGERGPAVIVGHVDSTAGPAVFYRLDELETGDVIEVSLDDGGTIRYVVERSEQFSKDTFPTRRVYQLTQDPELRLITCDGEFDRSTGHYVDNLVVFARVERDHPVGPARP